MDNEINHLFPWLEREKYTAFCQFTRTTVLRFVLLEAAFCSCDLVLRFDSAFCWLKTVLAFCLRKTLPFPKLGCVLSQDLVAFLSRRLLTFCLKTSCVLSQDLVAFCLNTSCVLSQDLQRFVSRLGCVLFLDLVAFCLKTSCVLSQDLLRFVSKTYCVLSPDIQCAGSDTRPPMLDRTDFALWQQHIRLYCRGKENEVNILKSIDEWPFQMGTVWEPLAEGTEWAPHLGPGRPRVYSDLSPEEKGSVQCRHPSNNYITSRVTQGHLHSYQSLH
nr:hypothetical protein [Tanacetum cinerariifolium]